MSKKKINFDLYYKTFKNHIDDKDNYKYYETIYRRIKEDYTERINKKEIEINIERARLEGKLSSRGSTVLNISLSLYTVAISVLVNGIITAIGYSDFTYKYEFSIFIVCIFVLGMILMIKKLIDDKNYSELLYFICLRVLNDIENENQKSS